MAKGELQKAMLTIEHLREQLSAAKEELNQAWRERNEAVTRVKAWEGIVCMVGPFPLAKSVQIKEWGPGEGEIIGVAMPTPEKLTDILDEVARYRNTGEPSWAKHLKPSATPWRTP